MTDLAIACVVKSHAVDRPLGADAGHGLWAVWEALLTGEHCAAHWNTRASAGTQAAARP